MWILPDFFEGTHTSVGSSKTGINVIIITEIVGDTGAKVFKGATEGNVSISNVDACSFWKIVVLDIFACCASMFRLSRFIGEGTGEDRVDVGGIGNCLMVSELWNFTYEGGERKLPFSVVNLIEELRRGEEDTFRL
jgi:hypothetical protein